MNIKELIAARAASDPRLKAVLKKIAAGTATLKDTAYYSEVYSNITGNVFSANVLNLEGIEREKACMELLRKNYDEVNTICTQVQTTLDDAAGIHIKPQRAAFPKERVVQLAHSLLDPTVANKTIKRRANTGVANVSKGFHDSYIKVNAKFRNDAGLKVYISRETDGKCCEWCTAMAGRYSYGSEPDDVYRRHDNCGCTVTYENGKQRQDVWSKRSWTAPEVGAGAAEPVRFTSGNAPSGAGEPVRLTKDQAAELQAKNMPKRLTNRHRNGIIKSITINDFAESDPKGIVAQECKEAIISTLKEQKSLYIYDEIKIVKLPSQNGLIEPMRTNTVYRPGYPKVVLEVNEVAFAGKSLEDINNWFELQKYSTINSLKDAVIHETAHAKIIDGLTYEQYEDLNQMLCGSFFTKADEGKTSLHDLAGEISEYAQKDGLECIAECHVKLVRGEKISDDLKKLHDKYIK